MGWTRISFTEVYAQSLSATCDLDLSPSNMVLVCEHHLVIMIICAKIIFKSHHVRLSNGLDTILEHTHIHGQVRLDMHKKRSIYHNENYTNV